MLYRIFLSLLLFGLYACVSSPGISSQMISDSSMGWDSLGWELKELAGKDILPGFAVSVFKENEVLFQQGFGFADRDLEKEYTTSSVQMLASISKVFIGVALVHAQEKGHLHLDDPVDNYLPFSLKHPSFPDSVITIRHLATHTSGFKDPDQYGLAYLFSDSLEAKNWPEAYHPFLPTYNESIYRSMPDFIYQTFSPEGLWYDTQNFLENPPGSSYEYSNLGATLAAYILELASGVDFRTYTETNIFQPLKMQKTTWYLEAVSPKDQVAYYLENGHKLSPYRLLTYPDGGLYSSIEDLTIFMQEIIRGLNGNGTLLSTEGYQEMVRNQYVGQEVPVGIFLDLEIECCIGHGGNDFGVTTVMYYQPSTGIGRIMLTNISTEEEQQDEAFYGAFNRLFSFP